MRGTRLTAIFVALAGLALSSAPVIAAWPHSADLQASLAKLALPAKLKCGIVEGHFACWHTKKKDGSGSSSSDSSSSSSSSGTDPSPSNADYQFSHLVMKH